MKNYSSLITNKQGSPLRILTVAKHLCIRTYRFSETLKSLGYKVDTLTGVISYGSEIYDSIYFYHNEMQFKNFLYENKDKYDIIEVHNEPDYMVRWVGDVIGKSDTTKLVYNIHDIDSIRRGFIPIEERKAFNVADGIVYVSKPIQAISNDLHRVTVPTMVVYNYPTLSMINNTKVDWEATKKPTMVYEGGVNALGDTREAVEIRRLFPYRNLFPIFKQLIEQGNEVHVYAGNATAYQTGQHTGCILYPPTPFDILLNEMTKFKYNLLTFNNKGGTEDQVNYTTANKMWDGLCAGLPSLACWCEETEKYVKKHNIGWTFNNLSDIGDCSQLEKTYKEKIESIKNKREELVFSNHIWKTENMYAKLLGVELKSIPDYVKDLNVFEYGEEETNSLLTKE